MDTGKDLIFYHRSCRKLPSVSTFHIVVEFFCIAVLLCLLMYCLFPAITFFAANLVKSGLGGIFDDLEIIRQTYLGRDLYFVSLAATYPSKLFSLNSAIVSVVVILLGIFWRRFPKPVAIWLILIFFIQLVSSLFFLFIPDKFPYSMDVYSELYMKTEISVWLILPLVFSLGLIPLPTSLPAKMGVTLAVLAYSAVFGCVRYAVFIFALKSFSVIFMALFFFVFGALMDIIYVIGIYALYVSNVAVRSVGNLRMWRWLY